MSRLSLTLRLAVLLACFGFGAMASLGAALYFGLKAQLAMRDDAALVTRVDQIRTLLQDGDARELIHDKPRLFENMLGNAESLLLIKPENGPPLITVNPGHRSLPAIDTLDMVAPDASLALANVQHVEGADGTPFIYVGAWVRGISGQPALQVISGRLLTERTRTLNEYRNTILMFSALAAGLIALLSFLLARRSMAPLYRLAERTASISVGTLSLRIDPQGAPREIKAVIMPFNAMLERLERGFTQLKQVSADMAHDLRTPIGNMLGQIEVGLGKPRDIDYYQRLVGSNYEELQRLSKMIDNMLFLARTEHPGEAIERVDFNAAEELARIGNYFEDLTEERGVRLVWSGDGNVYADVTLFRRALANLVANAVRHAQPGSDIQMQVRHEGEQSIVEVRNQGETIEPAQMERLFDRFYRVDTARHHSAERSGLGLSIVASIMKMHGGHCTVSSEHGVTVFSLVFTARQGLNPATAEQGSG
ncbi:heavy metal sensor histidine kinase [Pseudomonas sp. 7P_10.2_Bac1]|uniref:heavy metal sensor histidine kinase n=1 Tax=Pseudomonas sp. 7P_10.2_Bac1 TaxID=2971614 RepID=UPI0021C6B180|nr:heavy metal sensor histidine kinase [Pseudomonas sp. 7P_10.2_Bac1]MCU1727903.1 heavy metal sensor histidine kinase [Pseudomonas sp. 7P_10.2_Bac1]